MPIQPLAPTLRLNSRENDPLPPYGEKVPASISWRRKARTSWRNSLASGGSSIGSKRKVVFIHVSLGCHHSGGPSPPFRGKGEGEVGGIATGSSVPPPPPPPPPPPGGGAGGD